MTETYHGFIDTAYDALLIFEACNSGMLPKVQRRFSDRERQKIRSGAVYVWDEEDTGMRRWTDGRTWSPSRVHGCFLIYYELEGRRHQFVNRNNPNTRSTSSGGSSRSARGSPRSGHGEKSPLHVSYDACPPNVMQKEQGLIKKALSLCTDDKRKIHLVCYYSREDVESGCLMSPTNDSRFAGVQVYEERYPEIGSGSGRFDRYGGGRIRSTAGGRQWNPISPESPGHRERPPAYMRSLGVMDKRSHPYRTEVYRYPSYGPYSGPVRHVNVPASTVHGPGGTPAQSQAYGIPSPCGVYTEEYAVDSNSGKGAPDGRIAASTPYIQHTPVYPAAAPWKEAVSAAPSMYAKPPQSQPLQPEPQRHMAVATPNNTSAASHFSGYSQNLHPVWQHNTTPQTYASPPHANSRRRSHAQLAGAAWAADTNGLMIRVDKVISSSSAQLPPQPAQPPHERHQQHQQHQQMISSPAIKLPPIGKIGSGPPVHSSAMLSHTSDKVSSMTSEDMRQLASLRLSLH
ncbi:Gluconate transport-inducing protein [Coemansia guatemalensis]|uniref:Gluconate transport-inducing protein n=1 Tax=Coemansia guatemalensis TaxID=2761395 RepID=A0A9W8HXC5_9FUNG|nr:Gluconate transport-inducing protein [Coemansia guatemalensis]